MAIVRKAGTTDVSVVIRIIDSTDGTPETGVTSATGGLDLEYRREGAVSTDITEADLTNLNDAHSDGGMKHIGNGYYRLDLPDAACASGATGVLVHGTVTGMVVIGEYIQLVTYDPFDSVRLGLTALPNAAADAAGGLPISDAGGLDLDAQIGTKINEILTDTGTTLDGRLPAALVGGRMDSNVGAISADSVAADNAEAFFDGTGYAGTNNVIPTVTAVTGLTAATVHADLDDIQARLPAALTADGNIKADSLRISGSAESADRLERSTLAIVTGTIGSGSTTTSIVASATSPASSVNDQFNGRIMIFDKDTATAALRGQATDITDYVHATTTFTVTALTTAPSSGDTFTIT